MVLAFVLVNCDLDRSDSIQNAARGIAGVADVHSTSGMYDIIIRAEGEDESRLAEVISKIKRMKGIRATLTSIVYNTANWTRSVVGDQPHEKPKTDGSQVV
jgi:DNA-binding Lrp family transcriptional regulator